MAMLVSLTSFAAALGEGYSKVTDITTLSAGDKVVLYCDDADLGITGWDGTKTATAAATGWVEYVVEAADGGVLLKDGDNYVALTAKNSFHYTATGSVCKVTAEGILYITLAADSKDYLLYQNANNGSPVYRMYVDKTGNAQYKPFYVYEVTGEGGSTEEPETPVEPETPSLAAPTFSLAAGTYTEAQEVSLAAAEGTIYYTLDGTTPTAESEEYTEAIVLDECGTTTIKAIAISGENSSSVATATYKLQLPIPANDAKNPYTAEEAIEVYDGGCYAGQNVYVTGVVTSASYNSTYGNYTITLKGGFQFYRFQETAENKFTEDYITPGDTLVACGKLDKYNSNYQLAQGCYLVEHKAYSAPKVDISNTKETAYTVEEAIALIDNITSDLTKKVYVKGVVSEIVTPLDANYGNITYNISTDGSKSAPQFQLYRGKSYEGEKFTSEDEIKVGDKVIIYGEMTKYGSTYEMLANNQLVALERESDGTTTGLDNITIDTNITKTIVNGQLIIIKNGVKYNAQGQVVK